MVLSVKPVLTGRLGRSLLDLSLLQRNVSLLSPCHGILCTKRDKRSPPPVSGRSKRKEGNSLSPQHLNLWLEVLSG